MISYTKTNDKLAMSTNWQLVLAISILLTLTLLLLTQCLDKKRVFEGSTRRMLVVRGLVVVEPSLCRGGVSRGEGVLCTTFLKFANKNMSNVELADYEF